ncbi:hypothetical protein PENSPDRAFT_750425 [Peniophora sp. CONT]|nr:hypothetical protein PENSPDRAFT_750425 [Peniophora sp. CONT]
MALPADRLTYKYKETSVVARSPTSHTMALKIARRAFSELSDVEDHRVHFSMSAAGDLVKSRISPDDWESTFQNVDQGNNVLFIDVDKPSWAKMLGFAKAGKAETRKRKEGNVLPADSDGVCVSKVAGDAMLHSADDVKYLYVA